MGATSSRTPSSRTPSSRTLTRSVEPATAKELLDRVEAEALQGIAEAMLRVREGVCEDSPLRQSIRRHPYLASALGLAAGFVLARTLGRLTAATYRALPLGALAWGAIKGHVGRFFPSGRS